MKADNKKTKDNIFKILDNPKKVFLILLLVVLVFKLPTVNLPYAGDAKFWYVPKALLIQENNFNPIFYDKGLPDELVIEGYHWDLDKLDDFSHPPLFYEILALTYAIFGYSVKISHLVVFAFSFLAVYFTYLLGRVLINPVMGFISAVLLFFSPMFFSQSSDLTPAVALTALTVMAFYFMVTNNYKLYLISGIAAVLVKEPGIAVILACMVYVFIRDRKNDIRYAFHSMLKYGIPLLFFAWWVLFHYLNTGILIRPENIEIASSNFVIDIFNLIKFIFIEQFRFLLTGIFVYGLVKKDKLRKEHYAMLFIIVLFVLFFSYTPLKHIRHILPIFPFFFILVLSFSTFLQNKKWLIVLPFLIIILFVTIYHSTTSFELDENLRFIDIINSKQEAINFLIVEYPDTKIWVDGYSYPDYVYPYVGYVEYTLNAHRIPIDIYDYDNKPFAQYFEKGDLIIETKLISYEWKPEYREVDSLSLELIKEIKVMDEFVKIYKVKT